MAIRVLGDTISGNCLKVKWILDLARRDYVWEPIDIQAGQTRTAAFLSLNPAGQVPVIVFEDGRVLTQSNAILLCFAKQAGLEPRDPWLQARVLEWLFWEQYSHEPKVAVRRSLLTFKGRDPSSLDPSLLADGTAALLRLEADLEGRSWLVGEAMTVADLALFAYTRMAGDGGFDLQPLVSVRAWIDRVEKVLGLAPYQGPSVA